MTIARGFAQHLAAIDIRTEVPPAGLLTFRHRRHTPFLFSDNDIQALLSQAHSLRNRLPSATHETLIGLLAVTGLRIGEAIRLDRGDIDWADGVLTIRESKFGKSRLVPIAPTTVEALRRYQQTRDRHCPHPTSTSFFISVRDARMVYPTVHAVFRNLCTATGIGADADPPPRIHDLRHTFAVRTLVNWYRSGEDAEAKLPTLSTYLGYRDPGSTYWYLSAAPNC